MVGQESGKFVKIESGKLYWGKTRGAKFSKVS